MLDAVNICGFMYTGRSAISAWIECFAQVRLFPNNETRFVRHPGGLAWQLARLREKGHLGPLEAGYFIALLRGEVDDAFRDAEWDKPEEADWANEDGQYAVEALGERFDEEIRKFAAIISLFTPERSTVLGMDRASQLLVDASRALTDELQVLVTRGEAGSRCVYANVFNANFGEYAQFFRRLTTVIVDRDPRDSFTDRIRVGLATPKGYELFAATYLDDHRKPWMPSGRTEWPTPWTDGQTCFIHIFMEDFIRRPEYRARLAEMLGLDLADWQANRARQPFIPEDSARNIGIHAPCDVDWELGGGHPVARFYLPAPV